MTLFLREQDVEQLLPMQAALDQVEAVLRDFGNGAAQNRPRQRIRAAQGMLHIMPAGWLGGGYMGYKAYAVAPGGVHFYVHLFDSQTGEYLAMMEADRLGQRRTGAASGVATKNLARADSHTLGLIGAGWQAESQLEAVCAVRPIQRVRVFARDEARRNAFAEKMAARVKVPVEPVASAEEAARDADIVTVVTNASGPVLFGEWLKAGVHVNAAGSNVANRREVDNAVLQRATVIFADSVEQAHIESADLILPVFENVIGWQQVQEIGALLAGKTLGRQHADDITFFKSNGIALEDVAAAAFVYQQAKAQGIGITLPI